MNCTDNAKQEEHYKAGLDPLANSSKKCDFDFESREMKDDCFDLSDLAIQNGHLRIGRFLSLRYTVICIKYKVDMLNTLGEKLLALQRVRLWGKAMGQLIDSKVHQMKSAPSRDQQLLTWLMDQI